MFVDFIGVCLDQIFNQGAKLRYMFGGKARVPLVIRTMCGAGIRAAAQHSQSLYSFFTHVPGLKVVVPSNPYDAKGLLIAAIRDDDPVIFFEHKVAVHAWRARSPRRLHDPVRRGQPGPRGRRRHHRGDRPHGRHVAEQAAEELAADGIECEIIDPRTTSPLDEDTILEIGREAPAGWSWSTRTTRAAAWPPTSPRWSPRTRFDDLKAPVADGDRAAHPVAFTPDAGGRLRPERRPDRRRRPQDHRRQGRARA